VKTDKIFYWKIAAKKQFVGNWRRREYGFKMCMKTRLESVVLFVWHTKVSICWLHWKPSWTSWFRKLGAFLNWLKEWQTRNKKFVALS